MENIDAIFERLNLQQIRSMFLEGIEADNIDTRTFEQRLYEESKPIIKRLEKLYPNEFELDDAIEDLYNAFVEYQNVYAEIGIKVGAKLIHQLLS